MTSANTFNSIPLWSTAVAGDVEPFTISIVRGSWHDEKRDKHRGGRTIPFKAYVPNSPQKFPVILWSHGLGGSRDGAGFISRFIASYGYVVIHVQHSGTDTELWEGKPGHPWDIIKAIQIPRHATLNRLKDIPFALNQLKSVDFIENMDLTRIGMSGHSFGAMTTQVMAGQMRGFGRRQYSLHEPRFCSGILYSPVPHNQKRMHKPDDFYGSIRIPLMTMTGTDDGSPLGNFGYQERLEVFDHSGGPEQYLLLLTGGDHMVYNGSRGKLDTNPKRGLHENIIKIFSLAFWETYLKNNNQAKLWLCSNASKWLGDEGVIKFRNLDQH